MSRIVGKPINIKNGFPWVGVITLVKDSRVVTMRNGKKQWSGFGTFEETPKGEKNEKYTVGVNTGFNSGLADMLIAFPKGTRLLIFGSMKLSEYWTQRKGKETYELVAEFVHDQHDYYAANNARLDAQVPVDEYGNNYDPEF